MTKLIKITKKISLMIALVLFFSSNAFAGELNNPWNEYEGMYRYNSIQNAIPLPVLANNTDTTNEILSINNESTDNITKKLDEITQKQNFSIKQIDSAMSALNKRSQLKTFMIGNNLGILKFQLVQIKDQISELNTLALKTVDIANITQIEGQLEFLKEEQIKVNDFILSKENKFSLFGWFVTLF